MPSRRPLALAALVLAALLVLDCGIRVARAGRPMGDTTVAGVDLGGLSDREARQALLKASRRPLMFGNTPVSPEGAGVGWDIAATLDRARDAGTGGPLGITEGLRSIGGGHEVEPVLDEDPRRQRRTTTALAAQVDKPANGGGFRIDPQTIVATIREPEEGRRLDQAELRARMRRAAASEDRDVEIPVDTLDAQPRRVVERYARQAERYLQGPLTVSAGGETVQVPPALLAPALRMSESETPKLSVPYDALGPVLDEVAGALDEPARPPKVSRGGESVTLTEKGSVRWRPKQVSVSVAPGRAGRRLSRRRAASAIGDAVRAGRHRVSVQREKQPSDITPAQARRIDSVIGTFTTPYEPGQPRVTNIQRIARSVDGTVVGPGESFSLNAAAGQRTLAKGYVEAPFIAEGNRLEPSVGGGVSQFSTTLYNAAYFAGLPIDESTPHTLYIDRYPPGRETTLNFGSIDLRFTNDTGVPIVIQTSYTDVSVTVHLLGSNGGRRVSAVVGDREPVEGGDFRITVTRRIRFPDGRLVKEPRTTTYGLHAEAEAPAEPAPAPERKEGGRAEPESEEKDPAPEREQPRPEPKSAPAPKPEAPETSSEGGAQAPG